MKIEESSGTKKYEACWWPLENQDRCGKPHLIKELACADHLKKFPLWPTENAVLEGANV